MSREQEDYRAKLQHADEMASGFALGSYENESWLKIARGYRELLGAVPFGRAKDTDSSS